MATQVIVSARGAQLFIRISLDLSKRRPIECDRLYRVKDANLDRNTVFYGCIKVRPEAKIKGLANLAERYLGTQNPCSLNQSKVSKGTCTRANGAKAKEEQHQAFTDK